MVDIFFKSSKFTAHLKERPEHDSSRHWWVRIHRRPRRSRTSSAGEKVVVVDDLSYGKPTRIEGSRLYGMDIAAPGAGERLAEIMKAEASIP